jgi:chitodextrinase
MYFFITGSNTYASGTKPLSSIDITIPEYVVSTRGFCHYVDIPGGQILNIEGKPRIPYYTISVNYPRGYRVQHVILKERSGLTTITGLNIPTVRHMSSNNQASSKTKSWYPEKDFEWRIWDNPDASTDLVILVYPFYYNPQTTGVKFYKKYSFDIEYISSSVSIINVATDKSVYDPGDNVEIGVSINNTGKSQDITIGAVIKSDMTDEVIRKVPKKTISKISGTTSSSLSCNTKGIKTGNYIAEMEVENRTGDILDKKTVAFRLGNPLGEIASFAAAPQCFKIGDPIKISLKFKNTGSCKLSGNCLFKVKDGDNIVREYTQAFTDLASGHSTDFKDTWDTKNAKKGAIYYILAYVRYDGTATPAENAVVSTNRFPKARFTYSPEKPAVDEKITFDAVGSSDPDGKIIEYKWEFGDGGSAKSKEVTHCYMLPGEYKITLTVTDKEGATDQAVETVFIEE